MTVTWIKNARYEGYLNELEKNKKINKQGSVSFSGFEFEINQTLLHSQLKFSTYIPYEVSRELLLKALFKIPINKIINSENLINKLNIVEKRHLQLP